MPLTGLPVKPESTPIDPAILEEAADWLMRVNSGAMTPADRLALERWRERGPMHRQAWARTERLMAKLGSLPPSIAKRALDRPASPGRRAAVAKLAVLLVALPSAWAAWRRAPWQAWSVTYRTATGERRDIRLADGSSITLNTASAIDVRFSASQRVVLLRAGEMLINTARDPAPTHRPFIVDAAQGRLEASGTRFDVRQGDEVTHVAVFAGAVRVEPSHGSPGSARIVAAGQQTSFGTQSVSSIEAADDTLTAWLSGMMVADRMPLGQFAAELARYRHGVVRCEPSIAALPISGAFPVSDTDRALKMLAATWPVEVVTRTPYWVTLRPRANR